MEIIKVFANFVFVYGTCRHIIGLICALFLTLPAMAGNNAAGLFNSPKGFGVSLWCFNPDDGPANTFTLYADISGMPMGINDTPGIKFNYSRNFAFASYDFEQVFLAMYAGPGVSMGYVHDNGKANRGAMLALSGTAGIHADFGKRISLSFGFSTEAGLHMRKDERFDILDLSFYKNGFFQTWQPNLSILFFL